MRTLAVVCGMLMASPVTGETLHLVGTFPATARGTVGAQRLAIERFGGVDGRLLAAAIAGRLTEADGGTPPHYRIVGDDPAADIVLTGSIGTDVDHDDYDETRSRCAEKQDGKCVRREKYRIACARRTIAVTAEIHGLRPRDDGTVYTATKPRTDTASWCEDGAEPRPIGAAIQGMINSIAYEVRTDIAPHTASYGVRLREGRDRMPKPLADRFRAAVKLANHDERGGCAAFTDLAQEAGDHPSIAFNVAACTEAAGDYARAADLYRRARLLTPKGGGDADRGMDRVQLLMTARSDLGLAGERKPAAPL